LIGKTTKHTIAVASLRRSDHVPTASKLKLPMIGTDSNDKS